MNFDELVDDLLSYMCLSTMSRGMTVNSPRSLMSFSGAYPILTEALEPRSGIIDDDSDMLFDMGAHPDMLGEKVDQTMIGNLVVRTSADLRKPGKFYLNRLRARSPRDAIVRKRMIRNAPYIIEQLMATVNEDGTFESSSTLFGCNHLPAEELARIKAIGIWIDEDNDAIQERAPVSWDVSRGCWFMNDRACNFADDNIDERLRTAPIVISVQEVLRRHWRVELGYVGYPSLTFPTDPTGAAEAFRLRDIPEGRQRRASLRNWVTEHWRRNRSDPATHHKVIKHLRGAVNFTWNGLNCTITPCASALAEAEAARAAKASGVVP